jgi:hypothetical protein
MQNYIITDYFMHYEDISKMPTPDSLHAHRSMEGKKLNF